MASCMACSGAITTELEPQLRRTAVEVDETA